MAAKKAVEYYQLVDNKVVMQEADIVNLTEADQQKIAFYVNVLKYEMCFVEPEEKKRKTFKIEKAVAYIKKHDKTALAEFEALAAEAKKAAEAYKKLNAAAKAAKKDGASDDVKAAAPTNKKVKDAQKAMITANREAFLAQKAYFIEHYGDKDYEAVKNA